MTALAPRDFSSWRDMARTCLLRNLSPDRVVWSEPDAMQGSFLPNELLDDGGTDGKKLKNELNKSAEISGFLPFETAGKNAFERGGASSGQLRNLPNELLRPVLIPTEFISLAQKVACHRDPEKWALLYAALWRLTHGERHVLSLSTDPLIRRLDLLRKAVSRDAHKAKAFVRFRKTTDGEGEHYVAWHRPDHRILPVVAPFFKRRFETMRWTILTPDQSVSWDGENLAFGPGVPRSAAPSDDMLEDLWRVYYRSTFNPARIKLKAMRREMPVRYWDTMPETDIIADLLDEAPTRVAAMIAHQEGMERSAQSFLPAMRDLSALRQAAASCQGCPLYQKAGCTVFGMGRENATIMLVGEQPGDEEDKAGQPFIGPAGKLLDQALAEAGIRRDELYLTNAVKHFGHTVREDGRRIHVTPRIREIIACKPWLEAEIEAVSPRVIVTLGVTAGRSLLGAGFSLKNQRGQVIQRDSGEKIITTIHPAAILRASDAAQNRTFYQDFVAALVLARDQAVM